MDSKSEPNIVVRQAHPIFFVKHLNVLPVFHNFDRCRKNPPYRLKGWLGRCLCAWEAGFIVHQVKGQSQRLGSRLNFSVGMEWSMMVLGFAECSKKTYTSQVQS